MKDYIEERAVEIANYIIETKAEKSLEALQKLTDHAAKVIRNENITVISNSKMDKDPESREEKKEY